MASTPRQRSQASLGEAPHLDVGIVTPGEYQGLRITPNVYTTLEEIDTFAEVMEKIIRRGSLPVVQAYNTTHAPGQIRLGKQITAAVFEGDLARPIPDHKVCDLIRRSETESIPLQ